MFNLDWQTVLLVIAGIIVGSIALTFVHNRLRWLVWWIFEIPAALLSGASELLDQHERSLAARILGNLAGLLEEAAADGAKAPRWNGWFVIGPLLYFVLLTIFFTADFTIALLVFKALKLTVEGDADFSIPLPLHIAAAVLFVALGVFWGILIFDLHEATSFSHLWARLDNLRPMLLRLAWTCLGLTLVAALLMGLWSQWQLAPPPPEPWNSAFPPAIRAIIVLLVVCATFFAGKPLGTVVAVMRLLLLIIRRGATLLFWRICRWLLLLLRRLIQLPLALLGLAASTGESLRNWFCTFELSRKLHLQPARVDALPELGDDQVVRSTLVRGSDVPDAQTITEGNAKLELAPSGNGMAA